MPDESTTPVMPPVAPPTPVSDTPAPSNPPLEPNISDDKPASSAIVEPTPAQDKEAPATPPVDPEIPASVARKIGESHNVLIALSSDPSVDELACAIGLSIYLDKLGKRATAIYSGSTPNALEFLKPEETFEATADTLQDFVIALNKDKADHLRYKLDGDYVKIYITPYKTRIDESDLDFSYGDFNVDLVLALDVANGIDLDAALREHGRIMHDAIIVNVTTGNPGKFGEIEWSDKSASSVSEMIALLLYGINSKTKIEKEEATAFLTGIVAATNRFSNAHTTPETMRLASRLMESGANQQLIAKNITPDMDNEMFSLGNAPASDLAPELRDDDSTKLDIRHGHEENVDESKEVSDTITEKESTLLDDLKAAEASLAQTGAETTPDLSGRPVRLDELGDKTDAGSSDSSSNSDDITSDKPSNTTADAFAGTIADTTSDTSSDATSSTSDAPSDTSSVFTAPKPSSELTIEPSSSLTSDVSSGTSASSDLPPLPEAPDFSTDTLPPVTAPEPSGDLSSGLSDTTSEPTSEATTGPDTSNGMPSATAEGINSTGPEKVIAPTSDFTSDISDTGSDKYSKMLEDALAGISGGDTASSTDATPAGAPAPVDGFTASNPMSNPATMSAPTVPTNPEINGVPSINYMPMPGEEVLPPPPAPPIDISTAPNPFTAPIEPANPFTSSTEAANPFATAPSTDPATPIEPAAPSAPTAPTAPADPAGSTDPSAFRIPGM